MENNSGVIKVIRTARQTRERYTPERLERMFQAARLYYEVLKLGPDNCPFCIHSINLRESVEPLCPYCHEQWKSEHRERLNQEEVANLLSSPIYKISRSEIQRLLGEAEEYGMIEFLITRAPRSADLMAREVMLQSKFGLVEVHLIAGREDLFDESKTREMHAFELRSRRGAILQSAAKAAAHAIVTILTKAHLAAKAKNKTKAAENGESEHPSSTLCLSWGFTLQNVISQLRPEMPIPDLRIVPMVGALSSKPFDELYDSNLGVQDAARVFQCEANAYWLPAPAFVRVEPEKEAYESNPIVDKTLKMMSDVTLTVCSLGFPHPSESTVVKGGLFTETDVKRMIDKYAVGEIGGHFFDKHGEAVEGMHPIGMSLRDLKGLVTKGRISMAVLAGNPERVKPLHVAIRQGLVNALVTDHVTADHLLALDSATTP